MAEALRVRQEGCRGREGHLGDDGKVGEAGTAYVVPRLTRSTNLEIRADMVIVAKKKTLFDDRPVEINEVRQQQAPLRVRRPLWFLDYTDAYLVDFHHQTRFVCAERRDPRPTGPVQTTTPKTRPRRREQQEYPPPSARETRRRQRQLQGRVGDQNQEYSSFAIENRGLCVVSRTARTRLVTTIGISPLWHPKQGDAFSGRRSYLPESYGRPTIAAPNDGGGAEYLHPTKRTGN